jgi:hypothetical protein
MSAMHYHQKCDSHSPVAGRIAFRFLEIIAIGRIAIRHALPGEPADFLNAGAARRYGATVAVFLQNLGLTQDAQ